MTARIIPAIMSGGAGTRLWPLSTDAHPKQFHKLGGVMSLFGETVHRVSATQSGLSFAPPIVLCNRAHAAHVRAGLAEAGVGASAIVYEPAPRNTAAVGAIAAAIGAEIDPEALVLLLPADHLIRDTAAFYDVLSRAAPFARERIVTFGIQPDRPATGFGYIKSGVNLGSGVFEIDSFVEKPDHETAQRYLADGGYHWNSGMFLFSPRILLQEFDASADIREGALAALQAAERDGDEISLDAGLFAKTPSQPLDVAVMEKTAKAAVAPCSIGWIDIGTWDEIWRISAKDEAENALDGGFAHDASGNLLRGEGVKVFAAGVQNLIVIATHDAVIVVPRDRAQDVKNLWKLAQPN
ncbi:MAG: mannose-1-phosphate guanyltransferase [Hyphomonadaceae bacterium]|nr:mannose-1-phosphate guanyltransferase [Hyphomonadaceae bacterium]